MLVTDAAARDYSTMDAEELRAELQVADERIQVLTNQLEITDLFPQIERLEKEVEDLKAENAELRQPGGALVTETSAADHTVPFLEEQAQQLRADIDSLRTREREAIKEKESAVAQLEQVSKQYEVLLAESGEQRKALSELEGNSAAAREELVAAEEKRVAAEADAEDLRTQLAKDQLEQASRHTQDEEDHLRTSEELSSLQALVDDFSAKNADLNEDVARLEVQVRTLEANAEHAKMEIETVKTEKKRLDVELQVTRHDLETSLEERLVATEELRKFKQSGVEASDTIRSLESLSKDLKEEVRTTLGELEAARGECKEALVKVEEEKARSERLQKRVRDQNTIIEDYTNMLDSSKSESQKIAQKLVESQNTVHGLNKDLEAQAKMSRVLRSLKETNATLTERVNTAEDEKAKLTKEMLRTNQRSQEVTVALAKFQEKERYLVQEAKKLRQEVGLLKDQLRKNDPVLLKQQVEELTVSNTVLKEMVRSAQINSRVRQSKKTRGLKRPADESTLLNPTKCREAHLANSPKNSQSAGSAAPTPNAAAAATYEYDATEPVPTTPPPDPPGSSLAAAAAPEELAVEATPQRGTDLASPSGVIVDVASDGQSEAEPPPEVHTVADESATALADSGHGQLETVQGTEADEHISEEPAAALATPAAVVPEESPSPPGEASPGKQNKRSGGKAKSRGSSDSESPPPADLTPAASQTSLKKSKSKRLKGASSKDLKTSKARPPEVVA